ncbi:hypothetical protein FOL47_010151 [Perkinsus chesapeaki]|uniref:Uncharacterized protein n=1 Tax=Perkinsus chesapeaki TaxID=330153 RepID=A0A7J6L4K5_PERCH|nr:hypothetical protein FOL47_010151 [Perkinsus chesapeaki]
MISTAAPLWRVRGEAATILHLQSRTFWKLPAWKERADGRGEGGGQMLRDRELIRAVGSGFSKRRPRARPGFTQRVFYNHIAFSYLAQLCPDYFATYEGTMTDICKGSQIALKYLSEKVTDDDLNALNQRLEDSLYEEMSNAVAKYRPVWEIEWPDVEAQLDQLIIIMGGTRGGKIRPGQIFTIGGQQLVMHTEEAARMNLSNPKKWSKAAGLLRSGGLVNADVRIKCRQKFWIPGEEEKPAKSEATTHIFRIEMDLIPHSEAMSDYRPTSSMNARDISCGVSYEPTQWKIIDINDVFGGNPPMKFDESTPEMDEEHWKGDTFHTGFPTKS